MKPTDHRRGAVLAAVDATPAAETILRVAAALGRAFDTAVRAVHVTTHEAELVQGIADRAGIELATIRGDPTDALTQAVSEMDVRIAVVGCRDRPTGRRPAGHVALAVIERAAKPVVVVPPDSTITAILKVLLPLDGTDEAAAAVEPTVRMLAASGLEIVVAHVFDASHIPAFIDQPHHALPAWGHEFLARYANTDLDLRLRTGIPEARVLDLAAEEHADLIVLGWSQDLSPGHARIIQRLLCESDIPLLLVPTPARS
jgi:nucleotide-binding universal stress UspA family protein